MVCFYLCGRRFGFDDSRFRAATVPGMERVNVWFARDGTIESLACLDRASVLRTRETGEHNARCFNLYVSPLFVYDSIPQASHCRLLAGQGAVNNAAAHDNLTGLVALAAIENGGLTGRDGPLRRFKPRFHRAGRRAVLN